MSEIRPHITYSPENILEIRSIYPIHESSDRLFSEMELIDFMPGYEVEEDAGAVLLRVDVPKAMDLVGKSEVDYENAKRLVKTLKIFSGLELQGTQDSVLRLEYIFPRGIGVGVYPQFQRWLNAKGLDEEAAMHCMDALAYPFGADAQKQAKKELRYRTDGVNSRAGKDGFGFSVASRSAQFGLYYEPAVDEPDVPRHGTVDWNWINLSTIGNCACFGVDGSARETVDIFQDSRRLYEMSPHNVDMEVQALSLALGMGALAHQASQYEGREDILADAKWQTPEQR